MNDMMLEQHKTWQTILANVITDPIKLLTQLEIDPALYLATVMKQPAFPLRVPEGYLAKMKKGDINDPLLKQVLPTQAELKIVPHYSTDPLDESRFNPLPGLLHKYKHRVLMTVTSSCAINCRYCFRRHFPYTDNNPGTQGWQAMIDYIRHDPNINEVIYSGGDPLLATDRKLEELTNLLSDIPHLTTLRIHTRFPLVIPERITQTFISWFSGTRLKPVLVMHCNHPQELDLNIKNKMHLLRQAGVTLLNQTVLLKGINDHPDILTKLSYTLFDYQIMPYYLHLLDKVQGASHFDLSEQRALEIYQALLSTLPGYLVPKLVREVGGALYKMPIPLPITS